jgi:hypothetical protein
LAAIGAGANQQVCGVFTSESEALEAACYERTSDTWVPIPDAFAGLVSVNTAKPGLAYHIPRSATGAPVGGDVTEGYFALSVRRPDGLADLYLSDPLSTAHRPNPNLRFSTLGKVKDEWTATPTGVGAVLYEDANVTALKAVFPWRDAGDGELHFYPLFDGTVSASLQSGNDFHIMERGICLNLRPESWCGPRTSSVHGL